MSNTSPLADAQAALKQALARAGDDEALGEFILQAMFAIGQARSQLLGIAGSCPCPLAKSAMKS